jgi:hypothetical protein
MICQYVTVRVAGLYHQSYRLAALRHAIKT